jgi:hypothetical protein
MNRTHFLSLFLFAIAGIFFSFSPVYGDDAAVPTITDIHNVLLQAAGRNSDTPPTIAEQTELLNKALKMADQLPHVYHGRLAKTKRCIVAALNELGNGDPAHKAKEDIYAADDAIKSMM